MTPTPPSTDTTPSSAGGAHSPPDAQYRVVRKRNRIPLSCGACRQRKLKCNRGHPCDNCIKRGDSSSCAYSAPTKKRHSSSNALLSSPDDMQNRIDRLEGLVLSLMTNGSRSAGPTAAAAAISKSVNGGSADVPFDVDEEDCMIKEEQGDRDHEVDQMVKSIGFMKVHDDKQMFASDAHWAAILSDIAEVKNFFAAHKGAYDEHLKKVTAARSAEERPGAAFLFHVKKPADKAEIVASFPDKATADTFVARYFNSGDYANLILHRAAFQRQYSRHWANPSETPVVWLGMVYAIMCLALHSYHRAGDEPPEFRGRSLALSGHYRNLTAQCLILADFTQPVTYMIETLLLYVQAEFARSKDTEVTVWIMVGIITRLAMRMGYHRDSDAYPVITPFQGEMRRRIWSFVRQGDLLFSFQVGLPSMIRDTDCDAKLPRNILDLDFDENTKILPGDRPITDPTPISYMIIKAKLAIAFGKIAEAVMRLDGVCYDEVMRLDENIRKARSETPPHLEMRAMQQSMMDPAELIMQRFNLRLLYLKGLSVLHRKFLSRARDDLRYSYSRRTCVESSMEMLRHQVTLDAETRPGGRLRSCRAFFTSLTTHDFLLAAMIVCLELHRQAEAETAGTADGEMYVWAGERRDGMLAIVEHVARIWEGLGDDSMEAYKASGTLKVMLEKLKSHQARRQQAPQPFAIRIPDQNFERGSAVAPENEAAITLGMLSSGGLGMPRTLAGMAERGYPAMSIEGMMNNDRRHQQQQQTQHQQLHLSSYGSGFSSGSGLTPQYGADVLQDGGSFDAASPSTFANLFGPNLGAQSMELPFGNIDWDTWDSYIQGTTLDPANQIWTAGLDGPINGKPTNGQGGDQGQQQANNMFAGGNVFMGSTTM